MRIIAIAMLIALLHALTPAHAEDFMIYRASIACLNKATGQVETLRVTSGRGHFDDEGNFHEPRLSTSLNMERHIFQDGTSYGASQVALGSLTLENVDGALDQYKRHAFDGQAVVIEAAPDEQAGPWRVIWKGQAAYAQMEWERVILKLRDRQDKLARLKVQEAVYSGENEEIEGQKKPLVYGRALNAPMTLVDANKLVYQVSARPGGVVSVEKVYDSGVELGESNNILLNGDFDQGELYWNLSNVSIANGVATFEIAGNGAMTNTNNNNFTLYVTRNGEYKISIEYDGAGRLNAQFNMNGPDFYQSFDTNGYGIFSSTFIVPDLVQGGCLFILGSISYSGGIYNVSISPLVLDHATRAELEAAVVPRGGYHTCLAEGLIRLGSPPDGQVTVDVVGSEPTTVPDICRQLLLDQASFSVADFDDAAFAALSNASASGIYLSGDESFQDALDLLMGSVGAWWGFDRKQGKMTCGRVEIPSTAALSLNLEHESLAQGGVTRKAPRDEGDGIPAWRVSLKHTRNWTVQGSAELIGESTVFAGEGIAGVVSEARRVWLAKDYREAVAEDATVRDDHQLSPELSFDTLLLENAATEAARRLAFYSGDRERYVLTAPMELLFDPAEGMRLDVGGAVELVSERFGLSEGKTFLVLGMTEVYDVDGDTVELDVLG